MNFSTEHLEPSDFSLLFNHVLEVLQVGRDLRRLIPSHDQFEAPQKVRNEVIWGTYLPEVLFENNKFLSSFVDKLLIFALEEMLEGFSGRIA